MSKTFLKAEWRKLAIANYAIDRNILEKYLPAKTELDLWHGTCYVSLVGFMFLNTKVKGLSIPFHRDFEEVNLRFYVRYNANGEWKRGVVFIKEIVPKPVLSFIANTLYKEHYETLPVKHVWTESENNLFVEYLWKKENWHIFNINAENKASPIKPESEEEFITEHYWGYTKLNGQRTSEYGVEHPKWEVYKTNSYKIDVDFGKLYGSDFSFLNAEKPLSVFLAEGSEVLVKAGRKI